jgi:hypothetical protein
MISDCERRRIYIKHKIEKWSYMTNYCPLILKVTKTENPFE